VLVVLGEAGIGKTELLAYTTEVAAEHGMDVLAARGVETEAEVPFGGLLELLRPALDELDQIPERQAAALRGALDLGPSAEGDRFVIGAATLNLLSARSERRPVTVVVDDAHWLDDSSLAAILFAARRLLVDPIAVIFAARSGEAPALERARLPELALVGVDGDTATQIVARHATSPPGPGLVERLLRATGGNPLALVELSAGTGEVDAVPVDGPLPAATSAERAYGHRLEELPAETRAVLALAAAEDSGRMVTIAAAAEDLQLALAGLEAGERAGLLSIAFGLLSWRHPLVRSAAYRTVSPDERRAMHRALARALGHDSEVDRRAWHLAAAALGPDAEAAAALDAAARRARSRSAYEAAATAAERAAQLSPTRELRTRRLFAAAEAAWLGGHPDRALATLDQALELSPEPRLIAEIQHLRGQAVIRAGDVMTGHDLLVAGAAQIETLDPGKAVVMLAEAAEACVYAGRPATMLQTARRAEALLAPPAGERGAFFASLALGQALVYNGNGDEGARHLRRAVSILEASGALSGEPRSLSAAALGPLWLREAETGTSLIDRAVESARAEGALGTLPFALALAGRDAATTDRWPIGKALYEEAIGLARETGQGMPLCGGLAGLACLEARQGREEECRLHAEEAMALSDRHGLGLLHLWALEALAHIELGLGRSPEARRWLEEKQTSIDALGITDPDLSPVPELVEAGVRAGEGLEGAGRLAEFAALAERKGQPWALARLERCRGLLAGEEGLEHPFSEALRLHGRTRDRFEEARTRLCYGECLRRAGRRVQAREQLRLALEAFDELGAAPWGERARSELLATGERARRRDPSTIDELTPQELQIGLVLTAGHTTREAATKLFLSPKTVEYHLRNVYRKLGIHSRDELAEQLARAGAEPGGSPEAKGSGPP
jgi:DNA-binding CsgD family transcriptional regulator